MGPEITTTTIMPPVAPVNGEKNAASEAHRYQAFYDQILRLQEEVLAGKHPRFKLPDTVIPSFAAQLSSSAQSQPTPTVNGYASRTSAVNSAAHLQNGIQAPPLASPATYIRAQDPIRKPASTGINPILLEKSDALIKAEIHLKRVRIEKALQDAVERRKMDLRGAMEPDAEFDVSELLAKVQELVPPVSGYPPVIENKAASPDSFDENSYYSSQAMSWSSEDTGEITQAANTTGLTEAREANAAGPVPAPHPVAQPSVPALVSVPSAQQEFTVDEDTEEDGYSPPPMIQSAPKPVPDPIAQAHVDLDDEDEDMDYEPPAPGAFNATQPVAPPTQIWANMNGTARPGNVITSQPASRGVSPPNNDVPVIRNQIETPVAPQPARISPLATAKVPGIDQNQQSRTDQARRQGQNGSNGTQGTPKNSTRQSPNGPRQQINNPRKRRREENERRRGGGKRVARSPVVARSPEPLIKEEPMSPPPFANVPEQYSAGRKRQSYLQDDVEVLSPRGHRPRARYPDFDSRPTIRYDDEESGSPGPARVVSHAGYRVLERPEQDLRRIASVQYARRPYSPIQSHIPEAVETRPARAVSYAYERPVGSHREASVRPPRHVRPERSPSPPYVITAEGYSRRAESPVLMAPPPRPVIVDEYGNRYYAAPPAGPPVDVRASMAPPSWRPREVDPYVERRAIREPTVRLPAAYDIDERQIMPPPPPRRFVEEPEIIERPVYRQREYSMRPVEEVQYAREPVETRTLSRYPEMPPPPREYISRSHSVRPEVVPRASVIREIPAQRYGSVAPGREYVRRAQPLEPAFQEDYRQVDNRYGRLPPQHSRIHSERGVVEPLDELPDVYAGERRRVEYRY